MISNIETTEQVIALTCDDGPIPGKPEAILDVLKKENVHATFFVVGKHLESNKEIVRRAYNEGNAQRSYGRGTEILSFSYRTH